MGKGVDPVLREVPADPVPAPRNASKTQLT